MPQNKVTPLVRRSVPDQMTTEEMVKALENCSGNLDELRSFICETPKITDYLLFRTEKELNLPENAKLKERWQNALKISAKIRMDRLRCKAFELLEGYENRSSSSSSSDIAFAKTLLVGILVEDSESVKDRYRSRASSFQQEEEKDEMSVLEDEFDKVEGA